MDVFIIDKNILRLKLFEETAAGIGLKCYTMSNINEALFFLKDLRPKVIVLSEESLVTLDEDWGKEELFNSTPLILIGGLKHWPFKHSAVFTQKLPLNAREFLFKVKQILA